MELKQLGPYRIGKKIGQGGMGAVYAAVDGETEQRAAVKVLSPALANEEGFRGRFEAEIESLKKLRHPNIVRLYGYGEQNGTLFYAMELVDGTSLEDELRHGRRFEWREVSQLTIKLCRALKHAHDHGIIHRDIKPANLLLTGDGEIKLSDFGIARLFGNTRMTSDGGVLGTAEYMAPEQADGRKVIDRCDQYSLGGVMYALLAGRAPFRANTLVEMLQLQRFAEPQPVRRFAPDTPLELERIIQQLLDKEPQKRFSNMLLVARALEAMQHGLSLVGVQDDFVINRPDETRGGATSVDPLAATLAPDDINTKLPVKDSYEIDAQPTAATIAHSAPRSAEKGNQRVSARLTLDEDEAAEQRTPTTRFTKVEDLAGGRAPWYREALQILWTPQAIGLLAILTLIVALVAYVQRGKSADALFAEIEQFSAQGKLTDSAAGEALTEFLERFGEDSRAGAVRAYREEYDLERELAHLRIQAKNLRRTDTADSIQRPLIEAISLSQSNPELAVSRFQAIVDLYDDSAAGPETLRLVKIARRQLEKSETQVAAIAEEQRPLIEQRLARAKQLAGADPAAARRIYAGIVSLYRDKPWAASLVSRASEGLRESDLDAVGQASDEAKQAEPPRP